METIEVRGVEYKLVKARDFEVIVRSDNGFINYTKLCQQINENRRPFKELKKSETFKRLCIQMEISSERIRSAQNEASLYEEIKDHIEVEEGGRQQDPIIAHISGTYMPRYLLDYVIMTCDIGYYKLIHELMDTIDQVSQERQVKFIKELKSNINLQKAKLDKRKVKINDLKSTVERIERQNNNFQETINNQIQEINELKQDIDDLINLNVNSNQNVTLLRRDVGYLSNDIHDMSTAISEVNERVGVLSINNQKLNTIHDVFIIYFSESKPVDMDKRNDCEDDEIWLGTYNGQLSNYRRSVPNDAYLLYQIDSNRLDSFNFIVNNTTLQEYILDVYQRCIKIYIANFHRFIDEIDRLMNADGKYEVVRNLQAINDRIKNNERRHNELTQLQQRKRYLLEHYNDIHIIISRYKHRVYAKVDEERYIQVNQVEDAYKYPWFYRYGSGGKNGTEILEPLLTKDIFTNEIDPRITYE